MTTQNLETTNNDLTVPLHIRGMRVLERDEIKKDVQVHCYFFENVKASKTLKILKPYLLKINGIHPIQEGHEPCCRVAYLDPVKVPDGFSNFRKEDQVALLELGFSSLTSVRKLTLEYSNFKADEILRAIIPPELDSVTGYSVIGHIIHLNLRSELDEYKSVIGNVLLDKTAHIRTVVTKTDSIDSTFRHFNMEVIAGESDFKATVRENKCVFSLDFSKVYWNPRLSNEHQKVASSVKRGDVLFDVFCGIGPFVIPAAKKGVRCFANDLNPDAVTCLESNIQANRVSEAHVSIWCIDAEKFIRTVIKSALLELSDGDYRILIVMNLPALAPSFFSHFKNLYSADEYAEMHCISTPIVRVYCFVKCPESECKAMAQQQLEAYLGMSLDEEIDRIDHVRNVAPNKEMMVVQIKLTNRILVRSTSKRPPSPSSPSTSDSHKKPSLAT